MIWTKTALIGVALGICVVVRTDRVISTWAAEQAAVAEEAPVDKKDPAKDTDNTTEQSNERRGKEMMEAIRRASAPLLAELAEKHAYRLGAEQVLRRVAPPYPEVREKYYRTGHPTQAQFIPKPPDAMTFFWNGEQLTNWGMTFGRYSLVSVIDSATKIKSQDIEGPAKLLNRGLEGDWIIRPDAPLEKVLQELETILQNQFEMHVHLVVVKRVRTCYVARGKYKYTPLEREGSNNEAKTVPQFDQIEVYEDALFGNGGGGAGDYKEFLDWVGRWIGTTIIDEVSEPNQRQIIWHLNEDEKRSPDDKRDLELVLKNVTAQTGLTFKKELRAIRRILVEPIE